MKYMNEIQLQKLFQAVRKGKNLRDQVMLHLGYRYGMRVSEIQEIRLSDINMESRQITIQGKKNGKQLTYPPIDDNLWRKVEKWIRKVKGSEFLFPSEVNEGRPLSLQRIKTIFKCYLKKAGLGNEFSIKTLRHSRGVEMVRLGEHPATIRDWLRHKSMRSTEVYVNDVELERTSTRITQRDKRLL